MAKLKYIDPAEIDGKDSFKLEAHPVIIGRKNADLMLDYPTVSKAHAEIRLRDGSYTIVDLSSKNGTTLGEKRLDSNTAYPLKNGDRIIFGEITMEFVE